jgi:hypothetical protein
MGKKKVSLPVLDGRTANAKHSASHKGLACGRADYASGIKWNPTSRRRSNLRDLPPVLLPGVLAATLWWDQ